MLREMKAENTEEGPSVIGAQGQGESVGEARRFLLLVFRLVV